jgi:hypothetical protein
MLTRRTPISRSCATVIVGSAKPITTFSGRVTDSTTVRISAKLRSPGA